LVGRSIDWIKGGVINEMPTDISYGKKAGIEPSFFCNFIIDGEDSNIDEMMSKVDNGLIINNLWYLRNVDTKTGEITGLTRDGVNYFENGEIKHSLTNFRFNEIPHEVTKRILAMGESLPITDFCKIPPMLIKDFKFVDVTTF
jgi:predicted Zn-dependent protease